MNIATKILKQLKFANQNTWQIRAKTLEKLLLNNKETL